MKKSVICILGIIFIMGLATAVTSLAFAIESPQAGHKSALKQLPSTIKIDPNVINAQKNMISNKKLSEFKQKWKSVTDGVAAVNALIPGLEQLAASLKQKEVECMNKPFTYADVVAAGCPDDIMECSKILYKICIRSEANAAMEHVSALTMYIGDGTTGGPTSGVTRGYRASNDILLKWYPELGSQ